MSVTVARFSNSIPLSATRLIALGSLKDLVALSDCQAERLQTQQTVTLSEQYYSHLVSRQSGQASDYLSY